MNVLKSLFLSVAVAVVVLGTTAPSAKACDAFFAAPVYGQAFAFSNGGFAYGQQAFFQPAFVPSYGFQSRAVFAAPVVKQAVVVRQQPSINIVNEQRGLFGRVRSRQIVQVR